MEGALVDCLDGVRGRGGGNSGEPGKSVSVADCRCEAKEGVLGPGGSDSPFVGWLGRTNDEGPEDEIGDRRLKETLED